MILLRVQIEAIIMVVERRLRIKFQINKTICITRSDLPRCPWESEYSAIAIVFHRAKINDKLNTVTFEKYDSLYI